MKKKVFVAILIGLVLIFIGYQFFLFNKYEGNLIVNISNQSKLDSVNIELFVDGEKQIADVFTNATFHNYKEYAFKTKIGRHTILIKNENHKLSREFKINLTLVTWLVVDFYESDDTPNKNDFTFYTTKQLSPLIIE